MTILIVDNNEHMRRMIRGMATPYADEICECASGDEAVAVCAGRLVDYILMDIKMTGMDGVAAARAIRALHPSARVVIMSTYDDIYLRQEAFEAGCCAYVLKSNLLPLRELLARGQRGSDGTVSR